MGKEIARRDTQQRKLIRSILAGCRDHPTAETIYARARDVNPGIGFGTIYRNLTVLADDGEILRLPVPGGADRFDGTVADHGHYFCHECGSFGDIMTDAVISRLAPDGFCVDGVLLIATGRCEACRRKETDTAPE
ncbi:MAG: transcriptional repressor [Clostridia bacterium]|nr:transcriptional repressor [Clostridia bacterium]